MGQQAQKMQGVKILRLRLQDVFIYAPGLNQIPLLVKGESFGNVLIDHESFPMSDDGTNRQQGQRFHPACSGMEKDSQDKPLFPSLRTMARDAAKAKNAIMGRTSAKILKLAMQAGRQGPGSP